MAKRRKITPKQLDALLGEAARSWAPDAPGRLKDVVSALLTTNEAAAAVAHILVHCLRKSDMGKRAVYELMLASAQFWEAGLLDQRAIKGDAWDQLFCSLAVIDALALAAYGPDGKEEPSPTESDHGHDD